MEFLQPPQELWSLKAALLAHVEFSMLQQTFSVFDWSRLN